MTKRRRFSRTEREAILKRFKDCCSACKEPITPASGLQYDHIIPLALGGEDKAANLQPLCKTCHRDKTAKDIGAIRKADRARAVSMGTKAPSARKIPSPPKSPPRAEKPRLRPRILFA